MDVSESEYSKKNCIKQNKIKENYDICDLCEGLPEEFIILTKYILNIKYNEESCYITIIKLLEMAKDKSVMTNEKDHKFSFRKIINERFLKYKNNLLFDVSKEGNKRNFWGNSN